jgi:hypothetical protein
MDLNISRALSAQGRANVILIKELAARRYSEGYGWQVFVECYTDEELAETFGAFPNAEQAVKFAEELADARGEQYAAAWCDA